MTNSIEDFVYVERLSTYSITDAEQLGRLMPYFNDTFNGEPLDQAVMEAMITSPYHDQLVARQPKGRIVGAAIMSLVIGSVGGTDRVGKKGYLEVFVVNPDERRQGIGGKLWEGVVGWCTEKGAGSLHFTSHHTRKEAHRFYTRHGAAVRETTVFQADLE